MSIFRYYWFDGFKVDVFGYDEKTERFDYSIETPHYSKIRKAKKRFKMPDKRNKCFYPSGMFIYIIDPQGKKRRLFLY